MVNRIIGVLKLDVATFEEVEADESATTQAAILVAIIAVFAGISAFIQANAANSAIDFLSDFADTEIPMGDFLEAAQISPIGAFINTVVSVFIAWILLAALTYFVGTALFNGEATMGEMLRVIGFAQAPRLILLLSFITCLGSILALISWVWTIAASFIGIRQGLDLDNGKTLATVLIAVVLVWIINAIISILFNAVF